MATVELKPMVSCDGFRAESGRGLIGWVEETWTNAEGGPAALALRLVDGRRGLVLAGEIESFVPEREQVVVVEGARVLELDHPHLSVTAVAGRARVAATWQTTGEILDPPQPPGKVREALLKLRPWRLARPRAQPSEQTVGRALLLMLPALGLIIAFEITLAFVIAWLVAGRAY